MKINKNIIVIADEILERLNLQNLSGEVYNLLDRLNAKGTDVNTAVATAIYKACRDAGIPITITKICNVANANQKSVFKLLKKQGWLTDKVVIAPERNYVHYIVKQLQFDGETSQKLQRKAIEYLKRMENVGATPITKAVTAVYLAAKELGVKITQEQLERLTGVTTVAIRLLAKKVRKS